MADEKQVAPTPKKSSGLNKDGFAKGASVSGQITTDSKTQIHSFGATGMVAKNNVYAHIGVSQDLDLFASDTGLNPYDFKDGYIVATDTIYFGTRQSTGVANRFVDDVKMTVLLECETVKLSKEDATALLVGQTLG